jgi:MFS family permease
MDMSSELAHSVLPLFLSLSLGASMAAIGMLEGAAEAIAQFAKLWSGMRSDRTQLRKPWIIAGYLLAAFSKPLFPLAGSVVTVAIARFLDRLGKGIRGAPRDALVADVTPRRLRGAAFGLRQGLDTIGAIIGPLAAVALLVATMEDMRAVLWWAVVPAVLSVIILVLFVREPERPQHLERDREIGFRDAGALPFRFWMVVAFAAALTFSRFSEAFLLLRGESIGIGLAAAPFILALMSFVYAISSYPAGFASDLIGRGGLLFFGIGFLVAAHVVLSLADNVLILGLGVVLWGLHMGLTQGVFSALVADAAPARLRGTGFGVFYAVTGFAMLGGSAVAGLLWDMLGPSPPFILGAVFALLAVCLFPFLYFGSGTPAREDDPA